MSLVREIEAGIEQGKVKAHLVCKAIRDADINTRGLGYCMLIETHLRALLIDYKPKANHPISCFNYLIDCIHQDLEWDEEYALSREDALFELALSIPPERFKKDLNVPVATFWEAVVNGLRAVYADQAADALAKFDEPEDLARAIVQWKQANRI